MVLYTSLFGLLAQLVEQLTLNQRVEGSSPSRPTNDPTPTLACGGFFCDTDIHVWLYLEYVKTVYCEWEIRVVFCATIGMFTRSHKGDHR